MWGRSRPRPRPPLPWGVGGRLLPGSPSPSLRPPSPPLSPQYYEMSYGLNIEMHKQVCLGPCCPQPSPCHPVTL